MTMCVRWPRLLNPSQLSQIIRQQKNPLKALELFREARTRYPNYRHNGPVYAAMISILGNSGRTAEMKQVISEMREDSCQCQDSVFAAAIKTYWKAGSLEEAVSLFSSLPEFNCVQWTQSFNTLLEIMVTESKLEDAYRLFLDHSCGWELKSRTRCLNILMDALCQINRSDLALIIFQEMSLQCCNPDRESYRILMKGTCRDKNLNEATHLLYSMFWRISQKGGGEDVSVYQILLDALCDNGEIDEALNILGKVLRKGLKAPKKYCKHLDLNGCYRGGSADISRVKTLINGALIRGGIPSTGSYKAMAIDLYSEGNIDEGNKVLEEMQDSGFKPLALMYEAKVSSLCREGRVDDAIAVIEIEIPEKNCILSVNVYNAIIKALCDERRSTLALKYLEKMYRQVGCVPNHETYAVLVNGLCHEGKFSEASLKLEEMLSKSYWPVDGTYDKVIQGLCLMGRSYKAVLWLEEMISQAKIPEILTWDSLVSSFCAESVPTNFLFHQG